MLLIDLIKDLDKEESKYHTYVKKEDRSYVVPTIENGHTKATPDDGAFALSGPALVTSKKIKVFQHIVRVTLSEEELDSYENNPEKFKLLYRTMADQLYFKSGLKRHEPTFGAAGISCKMPGRSTGNDEDLYFCNLSNGSKELRMYIDCFAIRDGKIINEFKGEN